MSSSVSRSLVISSPTTLSGEKRREMSEEKLSSPGLINLPKQVYGSITEIHDTLPLIKAYDPNSGNSIAGNRWIPLIHSPEEIAERFGTIRIGMGVSVNSNGPGEMRAVAQIITNEYQNIAEDDVIPNTVELGLWEIFTPGAGL